MPDLLELPRLDVGATVDADLLVLDVNRRDHQNGAYTVLTLGNATGRLQSAPFWSNRETEVAGIAKGSVVHVVGKVSSFRDAKQVEVKDIRPLLADTVDWTSLLPSVGNVQPYWERLDALRTGITAPRLRAVLDLFYLDDEFRQRFEQCPAATAGHHAELGGLLRHTWEVAYLGRSIAKVYRRADADLVVAGAMLHDIGKLESYRWSGAFEITEAGSLIGHVALGMLMLERRLQETEPAPCTPTERLILQHLIASHHGRLEHGATPVPMTLEAEILHFADNTSAKAESMTTALGSDELFQGDALVSARGHWTLDNRKVFRGSSDWGR
jgi:3'-5' exoribonuclease